MGYKQVKIPTLWLLLSFTFEGTTSSCFNFRLLALPSLKELAITPADIYNYLLEGFQSKVSTKTKSLVLQDVSEGILQYSLRI